MALPRLRRRGTVVNIHADRITYIDVDDPGVLAESTM